jgi:YD repeat-containing protein
MKVKLSTLKKRVLLLLVTGIIFCNPYATAQTAGPTAPEYSSFEPIDISQMVNPLSGDFTYVLPIMEVPGPEGGYPIVISYHAGIKPNVEASWVGTGWSLNTGAVNRLVNGFPDDQWSVNRYVYDYWEGGQSGSFHLGVGYMGASVGLDFAWDTYQGFGVGGSVGYGFKIGDGPFGVGATIGVSPYGDPYASLGVSVSSGKAGEEGLGASASLGISTNFKSVSVGAGASISYSKEPGESAKGEGDMYSATALGMGLSLDSEGLKGRVSPAGISISSTNNNAGKISTLSGGGMIPIPIPFVPGLHINIGWSQTRYWSETYDYFSTYGVLHGNKDNYRKDLAGEVVDNFTNSAFDVIDIFDLENEEGLGADPSINLGGVLPATDIYSVTGQGISGSIEPYILEKINMSARNTEKNDVPIVTYLETNDVNGVSGRDETSSRQVFFRFNNDFSNSYSGERIDNISSLTATEANLEYFPVAYEIPTEYANVEGFSTETYHLPGSKSVKYYTNAEIRSGDAYADGFYHYDYFSNDDDFNPRDGFWYKGITELVTPGGDAMSNYANIQNQIGGFKITNESGVTYHYSLPVYAYNEYTYTFFKDEAGANTYRETKNYHPYAYTWLLTAITGPDYVDDFTFTDPENIGTYGPTEGDFGYWVKFNYGKWADEYIWRSPGNKPYEVDLDGNYRTFSHGSKEVFYLNSVETRSHVAFFVKKYRADGKGLATVSECNNCPFMEFSRDYDARNFYQPQGDEGAWTKLPTSLLALDKIILYNKEQLSQTGLSAETVAPYTSDYTHQMDMDDEPADLEYLHYGMNVIDVRDWAEIEINETNAKEKSLRTVTFETDYSLMPNTINSLTENEAAFDAHRTNNNRGKLTLKSVSFYGQGGEKSLPPVLFDYEKANTAYPDPLFHQEENIYSYSAAGEDLWGYYKSDYTDYKDVRNANIPKMVTDESAQNVDAWSLNKITTALGADILINYESDEYNKPDLLALESVPIEDINYSGDDITITITTKPFPYDLATIFPSGSEPSLHCLYKNEAYAGYSGYTGTFCIEIVSVSVDNSTNIYTILAKDGQGGANCTSYINALNSKEIESAELVFPENNSYNVRKGGGLRVSSISLDADLYTKTTHYQYTDLDGNCSGYTSYEPYSMSPNYETGLAGIEVGTDKDVLDREYKNLAYSKMKNLFALNKFIPSPGVSYKHVAIYESITHKQYSHQVDIPGFKYYTYNVFDNDNIIVREAENIADHAQINGIDVKSRTVEFKDFSTKLGSLKSLDVYGEDGASDILLSRTENTYISDLIDFETTLEDKYYNQGVISRAGHQYRKVNNTDHNINQYQFIQTIKTEYPSMMVSTTTTNYKTGGVSTTYNEGFDFFSGAPNKILTEDPYGVKMLSESTPAYLVPAYAEMGPKLFDSRNLERKNMISQVAGNITYVVEGPDLLAEEAKTGVLKADASVWSKILTTQVNSGAGMGQSHEIWYKQKGYQYIGDESVALNQETGAYPMADFIPFTSWDGSEPSDEWFKLNELTMLNQHAKVLETKSNDDIYSCALCDPDNVQIIASAVNARYSEVAFNNFEYVGPEELLPNVLLLPTSGSEGGNGETGNLYTENVHSGEIACVIYPTAGDNNLQIADIPASDLESGKDYKAVIWVYAANSAGSLAQLPNINLYAESNSGETLAETHPTMERKARSWHLVEIVFTAPTSGSVILGVKNEANDIVVVDDFRMAPLEASISSYVYDNTNGLLTHILDGNNFFTEFEYDKFGRLTTTYTERLGKISKILVSQHQLKYAREND